MVDPHWQLNLHHWHHHLEKDAGNYANISPLMDLMFGTYVCPDEEPDQVGIKEKVPQNYVGQLMEPMLPKYVWNKMESEIS